MNNYPYNQVMQLADMKDMLSQLANKYGSRDAFRMKTNDGILSKTYRDLASDVDCLGTGLLSLGLSGKKIALLGETSYEWILSYFAVICGTGVVVPIDKELPDADIANIIEDSGAAAVIYSGIFEDVIQKIRRKNLTYIAMHPSGAADSESLPVLMADGCKKIKEGDTSYTAAQIDPDVMASLIYTSGTTGKSKGIMLTHKSILSAANGGCALLDLGSVCLSVLPIHHSFECTHGIIMMMLAGLTICINDSMRYFMQNLQLFKPDTLCLVPLFLQNMYKKIWDTARANGQEEALRASIAKSNELLAQGIDKRKEFFANVHAAFGGNVKLIICGGAPLPAGLMRAFREFGILVLNGYGTSECSPLVSVNRNQYYMDGSVGLPIACCEVKITNPDESGNGEVWVRGSNVMLGYYKNEKATSEVLRDGWLNTGDVGHMEGDFLFLTGRSKNIIVLSNGKNVYPEEIEETLATIPLIREIVVHASHSSEEAEAELEAEIFPNADLTQGMEPAELTEQLLKEINRLNRTLPLFKQVHSIRLRESEFDKTTKKSIKRH